MAHMDAYMKLLIGTTMYFIHQDDHFISNTDNHSLSLYRHSGALCAIKEVNLNPDTKSTESLKQLEQVLSSLFHSYIAVMGIVIFVSYI